MKLTQLLFKPNWQDKNPAVRRMAVISDSDPALLEILPELARTDVDADVRLAAMKRLNHFELWRDRAQHDTNEIVRKSAHEAHVNLMCSADAGSPPLSLRMVELDSFEQEALERIAASAAPEALRLAALARTNRPRFLAQRASSDADAQIRLAALQRVTDATALQRIAELTRKTDKVVSRLARERLDASRIAAGDQAAIGLRAHALCEQVEALMRSPHSGVEAQLVQLDAMWNELGGNIPLELSRRYQGARALTLAAVVELKNPRPATPTIEAVEANVPEADTTEAAIDEQAHLEVLASKVRFAADLEAVREHKRGERERERILIEEVQTILTTLDQALSRGDMHAAHALHARAQAGITSLHKVPAELSRHWVDLEARYAELKRWQYWSNMQRRRELCADIEALAGSGMHPDALATRVREAREEWQRLDAAEGSAGDGTPAETGISRRFQAVCLRALRPLKAYFSKRKEVRKSHTEQIDALLQRLDAIADDSVEWAQMLTLRREASTALHSLDEVDPRARTQLAKRLKDAIARLSALSQAHDNQVAQARQSLIQRAQALASQTDPRTVARDARELQKRWTALGNGRRSHDQRQWREFRAACDAAFGKLDETRNAQAAQIKARQDKAQDLLGEFETLANNDTVSAEQTRQTLRNLDEQWKALDVDDRKLEQRLRGARESITARLKDAARQNRLAPYVLAMHKYMLVRNIENGANPDSQDWSKQASAPSQLDAALAQRYSRASDATRIESPSGEEVARELLVQLEFLAGLESPAEDHALRMQWQVQRLSSRMRDGTAPSPEHELEAAMAAWFAQPAQSADLETRFERAAQTAIQVLP